MSKKKFDVSLDKIYGQGLATALEEIDRDYSKFGRSVVLKVNQIVKNPFQPRKTFDLKRIEELARSIKEHGLIQPLVVKQDNGEYILIVGERRLRASKLAGVTEVPAIVLSANDIKMQELAILENIQRENLSPIEEALAYKDMMTLQDLTQEEIAFKISKSRAHVANLVRLLKLSDEVKELVAKHNIDFGHIKPLLGIANASKQLEIINMIIKDKLTVRQVEEVVRGKKVTTKKNNYNLLEKRVKSKIGFDVKITKDRFIISFEKNHDLNEILKMLKVEEV